MLDCFLACFLRTGTHDNLEPGSPGRASLDWRRGRLPAVRPPPQAVRSSGGAPGCPCASRALAPTPARLRWRASSSFRACSSQLLQRQRYFGRSLTRASVLCSSHVIPAQSPVSCRRRQGGASGTFSPAHGSHPIRQVLSHPHCCGQPHTSPHMQARAGTCLPPRCCKTSSASLHGYRPALAPVRVRVSTFRFHPSYQEVVVSSHSPRTTTASQWPSRLVVFSSRGATSSPSLPPSSSTFSLQTSPAGDPPLLFAFLLAWAS